jgi:putative transposase
VADDKSRNVIPDSIKLIAGRTGQEFNQRKARKGAYWEDRYHATAIEDGDHLIKCIVYEAGESFQLKEVQYPYIAHFGAKKSEIGTQNTFVWDQNFENATT